MIFSIVCGLLTQTNTAPARVAVVNVPSISEKYQKTADLEAKFDAIRRKLSQERDALRDKIDRGKRSLQDELKPGTEEFLQRKREVMQWEADMQWFIESEGAKVDRGLGEALRDIFKDIQTAVGEIAASKGYDIVLASDQLPDAAPDSAQQVRQQILLQKVIFWNPRVDITGDVITRLNENYKAQQAKTPAAPTK